ncbi:DUF4304 domain-containing protein [Actinacidiphila glaucinigra]
MALYADGAVWAATQDRHFAMNPLDGLIRQYVTPAAKVAGFSKAGRTFRLLVANGDAALLGFFTHAVDPGNIIFDVHYYIVPVPYWAWITRHDHDARKPDISGAFLTGSVIPSAEVAHRPDGGIPFRSRWCFTPDEATSSSSCGVALERTLRDETFPQIRHLLDRRRLLEATASNDPFLSARMKPLMREIVLKIDDAPDDEITRLLSAAQAAGVMDSFIHWARTRFISRSQDREGGE